MKKITVVLSILGLLWGLAFIVSCNNERDRNEESDIIVMDLGRALYISKLKEFRGDTIKADSAYHADKLGLIHDIYKSAQKIANKK